MKMSSLFKQRLKLIKTDSRVFEEVKASVQEKIYINDITLPIEEGDVFEYVLPSGILQILHVTKVTLYNVGSSLDHYEITYQKE
ncbi:MAG: hypothetical protein RLZZ76_533 [Candidatus Parcubacteria bacterium]|jgi:hypothetical protein